MPFDGGPSRVLGRWDLIAPSVASSEDVGKPINFARTKWIPRREGDKPVSPATVYRWIRKGVLGVKLQVLYTPNGCATSEAAVREFLSSVDAARRTASFADNTIDATEGELAAAGAFVSCVN